MTPDAATPTASLAGDVLLDAQGRPMAAFPTRVADKCADTEMEFEVMVSINQALSGGFGAGRGIEGVDAFRQDVAAAQELGCDIADLATRYAEDSARATWVGQPGIPADLQEALVPATAAWMLAPDAYHQEDARARIVETIVAYKAAHRVSVTYLSPPASSLDSSSLRHELDDLKRKLRFAGVTVY